MNTQTNNSSSSNYDNTLRPFIGPKMFYKFTHLTAEEALTQINKLTDNFAPSSGIPPEFIENLHNDVEKRGWSLYGFLYAPTNVDVLKQVIGKNGCYFHKTTEECNIDFLWHNREHNRFEFFGQKANLIHAMNIIRSRIAKVSAIHNGSSQHSVHVSFNNTDEPKVDNVPVHKNKNFQKKTWVKVLKNEEKQ